MFRRSRFRSPDIPGEPRGVPPLTQQQETRVSSQREDDAQEQTLRVPIHRQRSVSHSRSVSSAERSSLFPFGSERKPAADPLGLQVVCEPETSKGDIVFVHGLGGSAWKTWSHERKPENFWPKWLPEDSDLSSFRISTFGYNANFKGAVTNLAITDFAKDLLLQLRSSFVGGRPDGPIIFVAHSMGGLVVKKAYMLGKRDEQQYAQITAGVLGMVFLGTPHRGAQYTKLLNNILSAAPIAARPKIYVAELDKQSTSIQDINEDFGKSCKNLVLASFYETLRSNLVITRIFVVEKDSAVLGYDNEVSASMHADHHSICKFRNRADPNFLKLRGVLKGWVSRHGESRQPNSLSPMMNNAETVKRIQTILGIYDMAETEDSLLSIRGNLHTGSGQWLNEKTEYRAWVESQAPELGPKFFWLMALPGTGKTLLSARVIEQTQSRSHDVQYHFFHYGHQTRRTIAYCLRSIATQLAQGNHVFQSALSKFYEDTGISFNSLGHNFQTIWEKIFVGIIFQLPLSKPLIWILDGIDEADTPSVLISHISKIPSRAPIKIYLSSRPLKGPLLFETSHLASYFMQNSDTIEDIRTYAQKVVCGAIPDDLSLQQDVVDQILENASGSFLWVKLALESLQESWHTREGIQAALREIPRGMMPMYKRMLEIITSSGPQSRQLAQRILSWAACSWRPLDIDELKEGLEPEFGTFTNLAATVTQICGHFIAIDQPGSVKPHMSLIHATSREFLLAGDGEQAAFVDSKEGHRHMAMTCLAYLSNDRWRRYYSSLLTSGMIQLGQASSNGSVFSQNGSPFLGYATRYWAYHVSKAPVDSPELLEAMKTFFSSYCLSWIEGVALFGNLRYLSRSAKYLHIYVKRRTRKSEIANPDTNHPLELGLDWVQAWAVDLLRVVSKFGPNLLRSPASIHKHVPQFCPKQSMIGKAFGAARSGSLSVEGLPSSGWDDCLASVDVGSGDFVSRVLATETVFVTLASSEGKVAVWSADTCEKLKTLRHGEYVTLMVLNSSGTLLATSGFRTICVWELSSGRRLQSIEKDPDTRVRDIAFGPEDSELLVGLDSCIIGFYSLETGNVTRVFVPRFPENNKTYYGCPGKIAISPHLNKVAMTWRGRAPLVWDINTTKPPLPLNCRISKQNDSLLNPQQPVWKPDTGALMVLCSNTTLVEWRVFDDEQLEYDHINARDITVSNDGNFLLSRDNQGTTSIWTFPGLNHVYSLLNDNDPATDMVFSPSGQRFYDIRGSVCNVWEPDALIRLDDHDLEDHSSSGVGFALAESTTSSTSGSRILITAMAVSSNDKYFCCGREDGSVVIADAFNGSKLRKAYGHTSSCDVIALAWSPSGKYMASCNEYGQVIVKRLQMKEEGKWAVFPVLDVKLAELAHQFLFSKSEKFLLISTPVQDRVCDLKSKQEMHVQNWGPRQTRRWVQHPTKPAELIWVDSSELRIFQWASFEAVDVFRTRPTSMDGTVSRRNSEGSGSLSRSISPSSFGQKGVHWATTLQAEDGQYLVFASHRQGSGVDLKPAMTHFSCEIEVLHTADFTANPTQAQGDQPLNPVSEDVNGFLPTTLRMSRSLAKHVKLLVGVQGQNLVFLDNEGWLCTWDVLTAADVPSPTNSVDEEQQHDSVESNDEDVTGLRRHFFMPKDWLNTNTSHLVIMNGHGALFCPKYGDIAIVRNGIQL